MVEQIHVGEAHGEVPDVRRGVAAPGLVVRLPTQPAHIGRGRDGGEEVVVDTRRPLGLAADVNPERFRFDEPAIASIQPYPHLTPPVGGGRTPPAQPQRFLEVDRLDDIDHGATHDPQRVGLLGLHSPQVILADVLDMPGSPVQP